MGKASVTLLYPNDTQLKIDGDPAIIKQLLSRLDGQIIEFTNENTLIGLATKKV